jgi:alkylation response protein AidB-like acyl-CoA dehydrogenase
VRAFIRDEVPPELIEQIQSAPDGSASEAGREFKRLLGQKGLLGVSWPTEYGGGGKPLVHQFILTEELGYHGLPYGGLSLTSVGPTLFRAGTDEQRQEYLSGILSGEVEFALGYSEPSAGTDLGSLQTRAVADGDDYVINGQKIYTSAAHYSTHIWLAARTDPNEPKHRGVSLMIVPLDAPGITIRPLWTMGDGRTNEVFFEDVRVPRKNLVGEENRGFYVVAMALDYERAAVAPISPLKRSLDELTQFARETSRNGATLAEDPIVRHKLADLAVQVGILRLLSYRNAWMIENEMVPTKEASIAKIWSSELTQRLAVEALEMMGPRGQLKPGSRWANLQGRFERMYRQAPLMRFGAGTNEIQRNIIAQRGLGLPR